MIMACLTYNTRPVWLRISRSLVCQRQTKLPDTIADNTTQLNQAHVQYLRGTGGSTVEKPAETQTSIWLASHLV
jgi:hypothetical protein